MPTGDNQRRTLPGAAARDAVMRQNKDLWAKFTIERSRARRKCPKADVKTIAQISNWVKHLNSHIWQIHFTRTSPELTVFDTVDVEAHRGITPLALLKLRTRRLSGNFRSLWCTFSKGDDYLTEDVADLFAVHKSPVSFGDVTCGSYALVIRDLALRHHAILSENSNQHPVAPSCDDKFGLGDGWWLGINDMTEEWFTEEAMLKINDAFDAIPDFNFSAYRDEEPQVEDTNPLNRPPEITFKNVRPFRPLQPQTDKRWRSHLESLRESFRRPDQRTDPSVGCVMVEYHLRPSMHAVTNPGTQMGGARPFPDSVERRLGHDRGQAVFHGGLGRPGGTRRVTCARTGRVLAEIQVPHSRRQIRTWGACDGIALFTELSEAASRCLVHLPREINEILWQHWLDYREWDEDTNLWGDAIFELAWQGHSPLLQADRFYWLDNNSCQVEDAASWGAMPGAKAQLPTDSWYSVIPNALSASVHAVEAILTIGDRPAVSTNVTVSASDVGGASSRFQIGLSLLESIAALSNKSQRGYRTATPRSECFTTNGTRRNLRAQILIRICRRSTTMSAN